MSLALFRIELPSKLTTQEDFEQLIALNCRDVKQLNVFLHYLKG